MAGDERPGPSPSAVDGGKAPAGQREPGTGRSGPATGERDPGRTGPVAGARAPMDPVTWGIALVTFIAYDTISVFRYLRLDPGSWDLGIFTEYVKQLAHLHAPVVSIRGAGFNLLGDHFQPIVGLLVPLFRVFPTPETLLVAQALLTAASVIPVCRAAQELLGTWASRGIGLAYGFSWRSRCPRWCAAGRARPFCGRCRWCSSRRTRGSRWPRSAWSWPGWAW